LLVHDGGAYGLGEIRTGNVSEDVFEVAITAHATWELQHGEDTMLRVAYGEAGLIRGLAPSRVEEQIDPPRATWRCSTAS
jgi:hypothetical protein